MISFATAMRLALHNIFNYEGRASRAEYWLYVVYYVVMGAVMGMLANLDGVGLALGFIAAVVTCFNFIVLLSLAVRRLHDIEKSGWWILLTFVPLIGTLILVIWHARKGQSGPNQYGADPLNPVTAEIIT